jgi:hypothetical protein
MNRAHTEGYFFFISAATCFFISAATGVLTVPTVDADA